MFHVHKVIAGKEIPVMLDDGNISAGFPENTERVLLSEGGSDRLLKYLHFDAANVLTQPFVKNRTEEITEGFSGYRAVAYAAPVRLKLHQRQESQIAGPYLLEEPVDFGRVPDIPVMDHAEYIEGDPVLLQERVSPHHLPVRGLLLAADAV